MLPLGVSAPTIGPDGPGVRVDRLGTSRPKWAMMRVSTGLIPGGPVRGVNVKRIVVGTDGSASSLDAVRLASSLAASSKADLHIVNVASLAADLALRGVAPLAIPPDYNDEAKRYGRKTLDQALEVAKEAGAKATTHLVDGDASTELMRYCDSIDADLLVLGAHGMSGAARFLLGSVPSRCAHHAKCSVLIARP